MTDNLYVQETFINTSKGHRFGDSDVYETFTNDPGTLYRSLRKEYGACTGKVYIDDARGKAKAIGWVFHKRMQYEDCKDTYIREVWVTIHKAKPTKTVEYHYA